MPQLQLYSQRYSSCAFRVRIALHFKGIPFDLLDAPGGAKSEEFAALNPQQLVPFLVVDENGIGQSLSIIEYIEETLPGPTLLPADAQGRARVRSIAQYIASEIQPLFSSRLNSYLKAEAIDDIKFKLHWMREGLRRVEVMLGEPETGRYCHGEEPTIADCCLVPQVLNSIQYGILIEIEFPRIHRVYSNMLQLDAVQKAWPVPVVKM